MKKFLSMALALVMALSLCTFATSGASAKDFTDDDTIGYKEAVDVISVLNVMDGYTDGSFRPTAGLSRGAVAKIICNLILGPTTASALPTNANPFPDVLAGSTFAGYIAYCADHGIISGYGDGTFKPSDPVSGYAYLKMLLGALGYDAEIEGYVGPNWRVNVAKQAFGIGLADGYKNGQEDFDGTAGVDRETAALLAFNMIQSDLVEYDAKTSVKVNGAEVTVGGSSYKVRTWATSSASASKDYIDDAEDNGASIMQFAELYFNKLRKFDGEDGRDDFGRPGTKWEWKGEEVGKYSERIDKTYWGGKDITDIYKDLGLNSSDDCAEIYFNGVKIAGEPDLNRSGNVVTNYPAVAIKKNDGTGLADAINKAWDDFNADNNIPSKATQKSINNTNTYWDNIGDGTQIDVFREEDSNEVTICIINYYGGKVSSVKKATNTRDAYVTVEPDQYNSINQPKGKSNAAEYEFETTDFAEDDVVAYTFAGNEIKDMYKMSPISGNITRYTAGKNLTINGTQYKYSKLIVFPGGDETNLNTNDNFDVYVYQNLVLYVDDGEMVESTDGSKGYAYVIGISSEADDPMDNNEANLLFSNGTRRRVDLAKDYYADKGIAAGDVVYYKRNSSGDYNLTKPDPVGGTVDTGVDYDTTPYSFSINGRVISGALAGYSVDNNTVYVTKSGSTYRRYVGSKNAPSIAGSAKTTASAYIKDGKIKYVFIDTDNNVTTNTKDVTFLNARTASGLINDDETYYYTYTAIVGNRVETVKVMDKKSTDDKQPVELVMNKRSTDDGLVEVLKSLTVDKDLKDADGYSVYDKAENSVILSTLEQDDDDIITAGSWEKSAVTPYTSRGVKAPSNGDITIGTFKEDNYPEQDLTLANNVVVWYIDKDDNAQIISAGSIETDSNAWVFYTLDNDDQEITNLFIMETDD